jgi:hypothetical protein
LRKRFRFPSIQQIVDTIGSYWLREVRHEFGKAT